MERSPSMAATYSGQSSGCGPTSLSHLHPSPTLSPAEQRGTFKIFPPSCLGNTLGSIFVILRQSEPGFLPALRVQADSQTDRQTSKVWEPCILSPQQRNLLLLWESHHRQRPFAAAWDSAAFTQWNDIPTKDPPAVLQALGENGFQSFFP